MFLSASVLKLIKLVVLIVVLKLHMYIWGPS